MPRKIRFQLPGVAAHICQRGHNREPVFFEMEDYFTFLRILNKQSMLYQCDIHAYVLMTNHIHLLATPQKKQGLILLMQGIGRHYVPYINKKYQKEGGLWQGRYRASLIDSESYLLTCMSYIEQNPVRAAMVNYAAEYRWSSYGFNALGVDNPIVIPHSCYLALGQTGKERREKYQALFTQIHSDQLELFRTSLQSGTPVGNDIFKHRIETQLNCKTGHRVAGRPKLE